MEAFQNPETLTAPKHAIYFFYDETNPELTGSEIFIIYCSM